MDKKDIYRINSIAVRYFARKTSGLEVTSKYSEEELKEAVRLREKLREERLAFLKMNRLPGVKGARVKRWLINKMGGRCKRCGWKEHPWGFDFDHLDPEKKKFQPSILLRGESEKAKTNILTHCQLLCANCHRLKSVALGEIGRHSRPNQLAKELWNEEPEEE